MKKLIPFIFLFASISLAQTPKPTTLQYGAKMDSAMKLTAGGPAGIILPVTDKAGQVFNVQAYGAKGDGTTQDSTAVKAAIAAAAVNGGTVYFPPGRYLIGSQLEIPYNITNYQQKPIVLQGAAADLNYFANTASGKSITLNGGSILKLTYNGGGLSKLITRAYGGLTIKDLAFTNDTTSTTDTTTFIATLGTVLHVRDCRFYGNYKTDGIMLGGETKSVYAFDLTDSSCFLGFNAIIESNNFARVKRAVYIRANAAGAIIQNNAIFPGAGLAAIEDDPRVVGGAHQALTITGNFIGSGSYNSPGYSYAIVLYNTAGSFIAGNNWWDTPYKPALGYITLGARCTGNTVIGSISEGFPIVDSSALGTNHIISMPADTANPSNLVRLPGIISSTTARFYGTGVSSFLGSLGVGTGGPFGIFDAAKSSGGHLFFPDEGANTYNVLTSRNDANGDFLPLIIRSTQLQYETGGSEHMRLTSTGLLGINATGPIGVLDVTKVGGGKIAVLDEGADTYNVLSSRDGANSVFLPLTLRSSSFAFETGGAIFKGANNDDPGVQGVYLGESGAYSSIELKPTTAGGSFIDLHADGETGTDFASRIMRAPNAAGSLTVTNVGAGHIIFNQNSVNVIESEGTGALVNTLYLKAGNVGLNTTNPSYKLDVEGGEIFASSHIGTTGTFFGNTLSARAGSDLTITTFTAGKGILFTNTGTNTFSGTIDAPEYKTATVTGYLFGTSGKSASDFATPAEALQWDGGSTNLVAATGRTSLGLGTKATTNFAYAQLYVHDGSVAKTLTNQSQAYTLTGFTTSAIISANMTQTDSTIQVGETGVYLINASISATMNANTEDVEYETWYGSSGQTEATWINGQTWFSSSGDPYHVSLSGLLSLSANDVVKIRVKDNTSAGKVLTMHQVNWTLTKVN